MAKLAAHVLGRDPIRNEPARVAVAQGVRSEGRRKPSSPERPCHVVTEPVADAVLLPASWPLGKAWEQEPRRRPPTLTKGGLPSCHKHPLKQLEEGRRRVNLALALGSLECTGELAHNTDPGP